jgi:hypothetical protein
MLKVSTIKVIWVMVIFSITAGASEAQTTTLLNDLTSFRDPGSYAPRQNASRAPGLWQHLKISFQAPRFDRDGNKTEPAKMLRVELNGVLVHENVELSGPTRGGIGDEKATGPLRIQGDHGAVAFRNIKVTDFGMSRPSRKETVRPNQVYPILVDPSVGVFRSFMDLPGSHRVVHAVSVRGEEGLRDGSIQSMTSRHQTPREDDCQSRR